MKYLLLMIALMASIGLAQAKNTPTTTEKGCCGGCCGSDKGCCTQPHK